MTIRGTAVAAAFALALTSAGASAQQTAAKPASPAPGAAALAVGATVYGPQGNVVGQIEKVNGEQVVLNTGTHSATLAASAFGKGEKGPSITMTRQQLETAIDAADTQKQAQLTAALVPGAALRTSDNAAIGTVKSVDANGLVTIERPAGPFSLKRDLFTTDANGLVLRMTGPQLEEALAAAAK